VAAARIIGVSFVYRMFCGIVELLVLRGRRERSKDVEILVLRHQLAVLRRQNPRPRLDDRDRMVLAGFSRVLDRKRCTTAFFVTQQARNVVAAMDSRRVLARHLVRDRDTKFSRSFDEVWRSIGARIIRTPARTPVANAYAERWVGTVRRECLDHLLIVNHRHLDRVLKTYVGHYNQHRPHRGLGLVAPDDAPAHAATPVTRELLQRRDVLGGLIHEYELAVA
jgi:transposase InsO family protein